MINLGDHVSGPLWPTETADFLMRQPWITIAGNCDRQVVLDDPLTHGLSDQYAAGRLTADQKTWLSTLPATITLDDEGMLLCHGIPTDDREYLFETPEHGSLRLARAAEVRARLGGIAARLVACGHSHIPRLVHDPRGITVVNPESVGLQAYVNDGAQPHVSETGSPLARYAFLESAGASWQVTFVALEYDYAAAAQQAATNGRPDWASALRSGYAG